jgi:hypothetical protein
MLKNISNIKLLDKNQLCSIKGGACHTVTCTFTDGTSWEIGTNDSALANSYETRCENQNGVPDQEINCM